MAKASVDNDPLHERLIFAYDGTDYRVVKCDTDGNVVAAIKASQSIEVTQDTASDLKATVNIAAAQSVAVTQATPANLKATVDIAASQSVAVTQATPANLKATVDIAANQSVQANNYGLVGGSQQKDPIRLGYSAIQAEEVVNLSAASGGNTLTGATVPAGEIWVIKFAEASNSNTANSNTKIRANIDGVALVLVENTTPIQGIWDIWNGEIVLAEGDNVYARLMGCALNDDIYLRYAGIRIDIDQ
jgi:hypothetical protein